MRIYFVLYILVFFISMPANAARNVEAKRECATCHITWLDEFKRKDVVPLVPYEPKPVTKTGKQDVASTERMCFSCHDGFVLDSRFMWKNEAHGHPVGKKPPKDMKIPTSEGKTIFPMNEEGKMYCGTCHTAHGVDWTSKESPIFMRVKNIDSSLCLACHLDKSTGPREGNHPIFKKPNQNPDGLREAGSRFANDGGVICESCHRPHGGKQEAILVKSNGKAALCYSCHNNKRGVTGSKHDMSIMAPEIKNSHGQDVNKMGPCSACHVPHGAKGPGLWARNIPETQSDKTAAMCTTCHSVDGIAGKKLTGVHSHPVNVSIDKLDITANKSGWQYKDTAQGQKDMQALPLFDKHGERTHKNGEISCPTCHDPHNWSVKAELKQAENAREIEGDRDTSFLRIAQGDESNLCLNCHIDKRTISQTTHDIKQTVTKTDTCAHCHAVHNAKGITLSNADFASGKTVIESWCRSCHQKGGLAREKPVNGYNHPLGVKLKENIQTTGLPLFNQNGKRVSHDGFVDCATCHNPHQWAPVLSKTNKSTGADQEGDATNSYLRLTATHGSKLCVTCHKKQSLVLGTDHDMRIVKHSTNAIGEDVYHSGVCGQCHAVHNSVMKNELWARKPGEGHDIKEQQCRSCHNPKGVAKDKVPAELEHPEKVMAWSGKTRQLLRKDSSPEIPVFDKEGNKAHAGFISCPSCHDPHQWNPSKAIAGNGKNMEGDALSSFLRNANSEFIVCADCHGEDALFRYKFFHAESSRKDYPLFR